METPAIAAKFREEFCRIHQVDLQLAQVFAALPTTAFFVKDRRSRFVEANERLARILGCQHPWQVIGMSDLDFRPRQEAMVYLEEDLRVLRGGLQHHRTMQLVPAVGGEVQWYITTKSALRQPDGTVCGVVGILQESQEFSGMIPEFTAIEPALRHLHRQYAEPITTQELADLVDLSERHFLRKFRALVGEGPMQHLVRRRVQAACQALISSTATAGRIAVDCGFYDQSAFTRAFRHLVGETPQAYRQRHRAALWGAVS